MSRSHLMSLVGALLLAAPAAAVDAHLLPSLVPGGCSACHRGHGVSGSPMLRGPVNDTCLACHESQARCDVEIRKGNLAPQARPQLLGSTLDQVYRHQLSPKALSRHDPGAVTCTSCHSPHRRSSFVPQADAGLARLSTRDPGKLEYDLCEECHGTQDPVSFSPLDLSRIFASSSRSYHPVHQPSIESSPSIRLQLRGRQVNCTDCHGNGLPNGPRGPHASPIRFLLNRPYSVTDGAGEGDETYSLCYSCHDRRKVLEGDRFPLHTLHVVENRASCASCHSAHGSLQNRALIRFGEETTVAGVSRSVSLDRLEFVSEAPGSGTCTLTCHGVDHAPKGYGSEARLLELLGAASAATPGGWGTFAKPPAAPRTPPQRPRRQPTHAPPPL